MAWLQSGVMTNTEETQTLTNDAETTSFWHRKPTLLIGGGIAAAALLLGGIGIGSAVTGDDDDDDDRPVATQPVNDSSDSDDDVAPTAAAPEAATYGVKDAGALSDILAAAVRKTNGTPTSMEAHRNGSWSVDFEASNGDETTVLVAADGSASVVRTEAADADDANDPAPAGALNAKSIASAIDAALAKANGPIIGIDLDDNPREAYSVQVLNDKGTETEIDLDTKFGVTKVDIDND